MNILIVTGERSAENYASLLVDEFKRIDPSLVFYSVSSDVLSKTTNKIADYREISVIGIKEAIGVAKRAFALLKKVKAFITDGGIDAVILMDFPEFNMRLARFAYSAGKKVIYYISPQVWAWRSYRTRSLFEYSHLVVPILPFERLFFSVRGVEKSRIAYFGHPLVDLLHNRIGKHKKENVFLLMPGSRVSEIEHNAEEMLKASEQIASKLNGVSFVWALAPHLPEELILDYLERYPFVKVVRDSHSWMDRSLMGILKSGTTTLEAAIFNLPMVVVYRLSRLSLGLGRLLIKNIKHISLPNLIAGASVVPELIGGAANAQSIADACLELYNNPERIKKQREALRGVVSVLGEYPVSEKIARRMYEVLQ